MLAVAVLALGGTVLPFTLFAFGQRALPAEMAGAFLNLEPLVGAVAGVVAFGDPLGASQFMGGAAIVGGIGLSTLRLPRRRRRPAVTPARAVAAPDGMARPGVTPTTRPRTTPPRRARPRTVRPWTARPWAARARVSGPGARRPGTARARLARGPVRGLGRRPARYPFRPGRTRRRMAAGHRARAARRGPRGRSGPGSPGHPRPERLGDRRRSARPEPPAELIHR